MGILHTITMFLILPAYVVSAAINAEQPQDTSALAGAKSPAYPFGTGPSVVFDVSHFNLLAKNVKKLDELTEFLREDGYVVNRTKSRFDKHALDSAQILIIVNALAERNENEWSVPTPSAFTDEEITEVHQWVAKGGSLLLVADHMPFPGAAEKLAATFGVQFINGFALDQRQLTYLFDKKRKKETLGFKINFRRGRSQADAPAMEAHTTSDKIMSLDAYLVGHAITDGRTAFEKITSVVTFTGSAFRVASNAQPLLVLGSSFVALLPTAAWQFDTSTAVVPINGWYQSAAMSVAKGRLVVFADADLIISPKTILRLGEDFRQANQNPQFFLDVIHWLSDLPRHKSAEESTQYPKTK